MEMVLYRTEDDNVTVSALIKDETIWITKKAMAELFGVQTPAISKHLKNIFEQGELREEVVVSKMEIPTPHGDSWKNTAFPYQLLQFRRHYFRWLQSKFHSGNQVSYMGNQYFEGIYDKGLCSSPKAHLLSAAISCSKTLQHLL